MTNFAQRACIIRYFTAARIIMYLIFAIVTVIAVVLIIVTKIREKKTYDTLDSLLDSAINNTFDENVFNETRFSALEMKLAKYLAGSQISSRRVEDERDKIKTLISDISHQTKTPIANILMHSELLMEYELDKESRRCAEAINEQTQKLSFLINALVKLSRLEAGIISLTPQSGDVNAMVRSLHSQYIDDAQRKGLELKIEVPSGGDGDKVNAVFDEKWTLEALGNIVDNAIKYTERGSVTLRVKPYEMFCCVEVADTGMGIAEDEHAQIFSRFYRGRNAAGMEGTGIGLYLARRIITLQGGYIKLLSQKGEGGTAGGSLFQVYLPRQLYKSNLSKL